MRHGREDRPPRHEPLHPTARGHVQEQGRVRAPPLLGLDATKEEQPRTTRGRLPGPQRAPRPAEGALPRGAQAHDGPERGKVDERLRVDRGERRGGELADEGAQRTRRGLPGIDPAAKRRHHGWDIGGGLAVPCDVIHMHPPCGKA
jgi:hypothetical protein